MSALPVNRTFRGVAVVATAAQFVSTRGDARSHKSRRCHLEWIVALSKA